MPNQKNDSYEAVGEKIMHYSSWVDDMSFYDEAHTGSLGELSYVLAGLSSEVGEVADIVKGCLHREGASGSIKVVHRDKMIHELGDILWFLQKAANLMDVSLAEIINANQAKLRKKAVTSGWIQNTDSSSLGDNMVGVGVEHSR